MPLPPKRYKDLDKYVIGEEFRKAKEVYLKSYRDIKSWTTLAR
jgi:hypothetical protein